MDALWVADQGQLVEIVDELRTVEAFGVDTEFHREKTYHPQLALVQVSWGDRRALIDPLAVDLTPFAAALEGPATVVMHAASQDLEILAQTCDALPRELFDTQIAAAFISQGMPALTALVERYFDVRIPKGDRLTDWLRRPLGDAQRSYAAADVAYLLGLHAHLSEDLRSAGRLDWALEECELLRRRGRVEREPLDAWLRIKEARSLRGEAAGVARSVAAWREERASEIDQPVRHVLSDLAVVGIAQRRPSTGAELVAIRGVDERHARGRHGEALLAAVRRGSEMRPPRRTAPDHELDRRLRPAVTLVAAWVGQLARDLSIETSMLATRADIEALLSGDPEARLTRGWRSELVGEPIRRLVEGDAALAFDRGGSLLLEERTRPGS